MHPGNVDNDRQREYNKGVKSFFWSAYEIPACSDIRGRGHRGRGVYPWGGLHRCGRNLAPCSPNRRRTAIKWLFCESFCIGFLLGAFSFF